jgi:hypothetical protein
MVQIAKVNDQRRHFRIPSPVRGWGRLEKGYSEKFDGSMTQLSHNGEKSRPVDFLIGYTHYLVVYTRVTIR